MNNICMPRIAIWIPRILSMLSKGFHKTLSEKWALENGLTISMNKTVSVNFSSRQNMHGFCVEFDDLFEFVKETTLASFMATKCPLNLILNISKQTSHEYPQSPLSHKMGCWSSYFSENMSVTYKIKLRLCIVYGPAPKTSSAKLDYIHTQRFRLSLEEFRSSPVESFYVEAHEPPLFIIETHRINVSAISSNWRPIQEIPLMMLCIIQNSGIDTQAKKQLLITLAYVVSNY